MDKTWSLLPGFDPTDTPNGYIPVYLDGLSFYMNLTDTLPVNSSKVAEFDPTRVEISSASTTSCSGISSGVLNDPYKVRAGTVHLG